MADLPQHALEHRPVLLLCNAADAAEPKGAQRPAMPLGLADLAPNLGDANLRHHSDSFFLRVRFGFSSAGASATGSGSATGASGVSATAATAAGASSTCGS